MYVTLLCDVEDFITREADDAVLDVARILEEEGLEATFCVVGEKARRMKSRGRFDVLDALKKHDVGLHTDLHSIHPTTCEAMEGLGWEEGVDEMIRRETPGVRAIEEAFEMEPSCWGGAGNTWAPQVVAACAELGIPSWIYSHLRPPKGDLHRFLGINGYPTGLYLGDATLHLEAQWTERLETLAEGLAERAAAGAQWCEIFLCHPERVRCEEFWDGVNFSHGANPPETQWLPAKRKPIVDYDQALVNLRHSLNVLMQIQNIEFLTIRQMNQLLKYADVVPLTDSETSKMAESLPKRLDDMRRWPVHRTDLDVRQSVDLTLERLGDLTKLRIPT